MSLSYVGSLSIGALIPVSFALFASLEGNIQAQLTGQLGMQASLSLVPPTIAATIEVAEGILASLQASAALAPPSVSFGAQLSAQIAILEGLIASLKAILALSTAGEGGGAAGIDVFTWTGEVGAFGAALSAELASGAPSGGSPTDASNALVLLTRASATWVAMTTFFSGAA